MDHAPLREREATRRWAATRRRAATRVLLAAVLVLLVLGCATVAQVTNLRDGACGDLFAEQVKSILLEQGESEAHAVELAAQTRMALTVGRRGPRPFLVSAESGTDYRFFIDAARDQCLLRLYGRRKGFWSYTNNLSYIATRPLPGCSCSS